LKFIHVAGTNGKGSTCAFLTRALIRGGYDVGTFTSPYIETFTDRIRYNGINIPDDDLLRLANRMKPIVDEIAATPLKAPTMFDVTTAIAIQYYATVVYPDFVIWETGIGGRLDPTNIVTPILSVITNVGHDHMEMLGDTLAKVAFEKAGIIKSGVPVVSAVEQPEALEVIERIAKERHSTLYLLDRQFAYESLRCEQDSQTFHFRGPFRRIPDISISLNGKHQVKNAAVSLMALEVLRQYYAVLVDDEPLLEAMKETAWPGRLEMICESPRILIDGAHNPEGAETLAAALKDVYSYEKLHLMMGMLTAKNHSGYLGHILPLVDTLVVTEPDWHKKTDAGELAGLARQMLNSIGRNAEVIVEPNWRNALDLLRERTREDDLAVVSGTLYLVSDVRSYMTSNSVLPKSVKLEL
jgi:dihydrofolate synthase/folylpolyglutamate synthase